MSKWFWYFKKTECGYLLIYENMVEFYYNNVNLCEGYYSPKLLATSPSNLQILPV